MQGRIFWFFCFENSKINTDNFFSWLTIFVFFQIFTNIVTDELPPLPANPPNIPSPSLTHAFLLKQARLVNEQSIIQLLINQSHFFSRQLSMQNSVI